MSATVPSSKSLIKTVIHMWHYVRNCTTLTIHSSGVNKMQERFLKSANLGQSQWLIIDLFAQQDGVRSDLQKGGQHIHSIENPH